MEEELGEVAEIHGFSARFITPDFFKLEACKAQGVVLRVEFVFGIIAACKRKQSDMLHLWNLEEVAITDPVSMEDVFLDNDGHSLIRSPSSLRILPIKAIVTRGAVEDVASLSGTIKLRR